MSPSRRHLVRLARATRSSLEEVYGYPRGECYRWSNYVACAILEKNPSVDVWLSSGELVLGSLRHPHSWVEFAGWIMDITADQFPSPAPRPLPPVWIKPVASSVPTHIARHRRLVRNR